MEGPFRMPDDMVVTDELAGEQAYLENARHELARMREKTLSARASGGDRVSDEFLAMTLRLGFQQQYSQGRAERQRIERRDQRGNRDRNRKLSEELPDDALNERAGNEDRGKNEPHGDDWARNLIHGPNRRVPRRSGTR